MSETMNNVNNVSNQKKEAVTIDVMPQSFKTHTEGQITTTSELTTCINEMMGSVFNDYVGCRIYVHDGSNPIPQQLAMMMGMGNLYADLYFEKNSNSTGIIDNLEPMMKEGGSGLDRLNRVCNGSARMWNVTKDTKEALLEFVPGYDARIRNFNPLWDLRISEEATPVSAFNNQQKVTVRIQGLDVDALIGKIYGIYAPAVYEDVPGETDEDRTERMKKTDVKYDYHAMPIMRSNKGIMAYGYNMNMPKEFVVQILRNDRSIIAAMQDAIGLVPINNTAYTRFNRV